MNMKMFQWFGKGQQADDNKVRSDEIKRGVVFDFAKVADVDDATAKAFMESTHLESRRMPLLIARHAYSLLEERLTEPGRLDALTLAEIRGGMRALRAFGVYYTAGIKAWEERFRQKDDRE